MNADDGTSRRPSEGGLKAVSPSSASSDSRPRISPVERSVSEGHDPQASPLASYDWLTDGQRAKISLRGDKDSDPHTAPAAATGSLLPSSSLLKSMVPRVSISSLIGGRSAPTVSALNLSEETVDEHSMQLSRLLYSLS